MTATVKDYLTPASNTDLIGNLRNNHVRVSGVWFLLIKTCVTLLRGLNSSYSLANPLVVEEGFSCTNGF